VPKDVANDGVSKSVPDLFKPAEVLTALRQSS